MALERDLEKTCRLHAEKLGGRLIKIRTPGTKGFHDRMLILPGMVTFLEFKHPGGTGRKSKMQQHWQEYLDDMHVPAFEVASLTYFKILCKIRMRAY